MLKARFVTAKFASRNSWLMRCATGERRCRIITGSISHSQPRALCKGRFPARRLRCATANSSHGWARRSRANWRCPQIPSVSITPGYVQQYVSRHLPHKTRRLKRCWRMAKTLHLSAGDPSTRMPGRAGNLAPAVAPTPCGRLAGSASMAVGHAPPVGTSIHHGSRKRH